MSNRNFLFIYNDKAGKGSILKKLQYIKKLFSKKEICFKFINILDLNNTVHIENFDTVVAIGGAVGVEDLAQAVRAVVVQPGKSPLADGSPSGKPQDGKRQHQQRQHRHLYVVGLDLLP